MEDSTQQPGHETDALVRRFNYLIEKSRKAREDAEAEERRWSINGIPWHAAPVPPRLHKCFAQTSGWVGFDQVQRCACGAIRNPRFGGGWLDKNSRGKGSSDKTAMTLRMPSLFALAVTAYVLGWVLFVLGLFAPDIPTMLAVEIPALLLLAVPSIIEFTPALREKF